MSTSRTSVFSPRALWMVGALGLASACTSERLPAAAPPALATSVAVASPAPAPPAAAVLTPAQIAARSTPAVVSIRSPAGFGTGFVVRKDGWIATNLHVVAGARELTVATSDKHEYPVVEVLAVDPTRDLALLRIGATELATLVLGDSDLVRAGDAIVAIGHPLGLEDTISNGLVSAVRVLDPKLTVLQISAPIAPGSSGGPLFSETGEVVGVATAYSTRGQNLNFGVPARYLKELLGKTDPVPMATFAAAAAASPGGDPSMPAIQRAVPVHDAKILTGCSSGDLKNVVRTLGEAIDVGAPAYNEHHFSACYHVYDGAAIDLEKKLPASCQGPKKALGDGRAKAAKLTSPGAQAWAMRDAFDGLLDVIVRKVKARTSP